MNLFIKTITTFVIVLVLLSSCNSNKKIKGSKEIATTELDLKNFNQIDISNAFEVEIYQAKSFNVSVDCNKNIIENLNIKVEGQILKIGLIKPYSYSNSKILAKVYLPELKKLSANGASKITIPNFVNEDIEIDISGAASINGQLDIANNLIIEASGASKFILDGKATNAKFSFSGASNFRGKNLIISNNLDVSSSGASKIEINANGNINLDLSGASNFTYFGNGIIQNQKSLGASVINKK